MDPSAVWFFDSHGGLWYSVPRVDALTTPGVEPFGPTGYARPASSAQVERWLGDLGEQTAAARALTAGVAEWEGEWLILNTPTLNAMRVGVEQDVPDYFRDDDLSKAEAGRTAAQHVSRLYQERLDARAK